MSERAKTCIIRRASKDEEFSSELREAINLQISPRGVQYMINAFPHHKNVKINTSLSIKK